MKRLFQTYPRDWTITQRTSRDVHRDACALQAFAKASNRSLEVATAIAFIIGAVGLYFWR